MRVATMRLRSLPLAALALAMALAFGLSGCGGNGGPATNGPLSLHDSVPLGSNCVPGGHSWAFGFQQFTNFSHVTVVLDRVALLHPHNERLVGSYAVPGAVIVGVVNWPPKYPDSPAGPGVPTAWKHRQPVHGFRLTPGKTFNMVLGVAAVTEGHRATSKGMLVYYHDSSGSYVAKNYSANIIAANTHTCA